MYELQISLQLHTRPLGKCWHGWVAIAGSTEPKVREWRKNDAGIGLIGVITVNGGPYVDPFVLLVVHVKAGAWLATTGGGANNTASVKHHGTHAGGWRNAVQAKMSRKRPTKYRKHNPILKGILVCEHCDKNVTWQQQKGRLYGSCQRKLEACKKQSFIREDAVLELIQGKLDDLICPSPEVISWLTTLLRQDFKLSVNNFEEAQKALDERIGRIKRMDDVLYDDKLAGFISSERYQEKHKSFIDEINTLQKQKGGISQEYETKYMNGISEIELSQDAKQLFSDKDVSNDDKRIILTKLFKSISLKDNSVSVTYTKLAQAIARNSGLSKEILGYAK